MIIKVTLNYLLLMLPVLTVLSEITSNLLFQHLGFLTLLIYLFCRWNLLSKIARAMIILFCLTATGLLIGPEGSFNRILQTAKPGLVISAFLVAIDLFKLVAIKSPLFYRCGNAFQSNSSAVRFPLLTLGTALSATVLLFSVLGLFSTMVVQEKGKLTKNTKRNLNLILRGFCLSPFISPFAIPIVAVSSFYTDLSWSDLLPITTSAAFVLWGITWFFDKTGKPLNQSEKMAFKSFRQILPDFVRLFGLVIVLILLVTLFAFLTGMSLVLSCVIVMPIFAMTWLIKLSHEDNLKNRIILGLKTLRNGVGDNINEIAILFSALFLGIAFPIIWPYCRSSFDLSVINSYVLLIPVAVIIFFIAFGLVGGQPAMSFALLVSIIPKSALAQIPVNIYYASIIVGWALTSITSPFNQKNSSMLCIGVDKIKIHFDTSQLCCGVVHSMYSYYI